VVVAAGEADGELYLASRFVAGTDLRVLVQDGPLSAERAISLVGQVADALDAAHERGLVHRDVKPANVLISRHGGSEHAYLTDFGVTKRRTATESGTGTGRWVGTLDYVAPEAVRGERVDGRSDIYSLGCVLYQCLTGEVPFPRENELGTLWAHISDAPPAASDAAPELSAVIRLDAPPKKSFPYFLISSFP